MHGAGDGGEIGLARDHVLRRENVDVEIVGAQPFGVGDAGGERFLTAKELDPAGAPQERPAAGLLDQRLMFDQAVLDERAARLDVLSHALGRAFAPVAHQPGADGRKRAEVIMRFGEQVERISDEPDRIAREEIGEDRGSLDQAGVAEAGLEPRAAPVNQDDVAPARLKMQGGRDAHHARAENDDIRRFHAASMIASYGRATARPPAVFREGRSNTGTAGAVTQKATPDKRPLPPPIRRQGRSAPRLSAG